ncbi:MAG: hypothetical protein RXQ56_09830 [Thermoproteus sp.]|jgi:hypothetical protein
MAAVKTLRLNDGGCAEDICAVSFSADCCCAADPQQRRCGRCRDGVPPDISIVDYICKCGPRLFAVEVTERTNAWHYKGKFVDKLEQTRAMFRGLQPTLVIVSKELKLDKETREYFNRRGMDARVVRPSGSICS